MILSNFNINRSSKGIKGSALKHFIICFLLSVTPCIWATEADDDFLARSKAPGVIKAVSFDTQEGITPFIAGLTETVDTSIKASGAGSMRLTIKSQSSSGGGGYFWQNFSDDNSIEFGEGEEFYIQWRQRFSHEILDTYFDGSHGFKQMIISEGDRPGYVGRSCGCNEVVVQNQTQRGFPQVYHSCGCKDDKYEPLNIYDPEIGDWLLQNVVNCRWSVRPYGPPCVMYKPNQWMTFQIRVKIGTWYKNDGNYNRDSTVQLWVAEEGKPSVLVIDFSPENGTGYDLVTDSAGTKYGKLWLLTFQTGKDPNQVHPDSPTWYDELIISTQRIPDPGFDLPPDNTPPPAAPAAPSNLRVE